MNTAAPLGAEQLELMFSTLDQQPDDDAMWSCSYGAARRIKATIADRDADLAEEKAARDLLLTRVACAFGFEDNLSVVEACEILGDKVSEIASMNAQIAELRKARRTPGTFEKCSHCGNMAPFCPERVRPVCTRQVANGGECPMLAKTPQEPAPAEPPTPEAVTREDIREVVTKAYWGDGKHGASLGRVYDALLEQFHITRRGK